MYADHEEFADNEALVLCNILFDSVFNRHIYMQEASFYSLSCFSLFLFLLKKKKTT